MFTFRLPASLPVTLVFFFLLSNNAVNAAETQDLRRTDSAVLKDFQVIDRPGAISALKATTEELRKVSSRQAKTGIKHDRYRQYHRGIPVFGKQAILHTKPDGRIRNLSGQLLRGIQQDIPTIRSSKTAAQALHHCQQMHEAKVEQAHNWQYRNINTEQVIHQDEQGAARLAYHVTFFAEAHNAKPTRPNFLVDADTLEVIAEWDGLTTKKVGTGPGGNNKIGAYEYGTDFEALDVAVDATQTKCSLKNDNVITINLNHSYDPDPLLPAHEFNCPQNRVKTINGAFSPLNDAHYFGGEIFNMFTSWYNRPPLNFPLTLYVHYGHYYENAFWDGQSMTFGDGGNYFYPLTSLDVVGHEVAHGFTEQHSNLIYWQQSGGINEAFSDMAGKAAEFYSRGSNNWHIAMDITKQTSEALRYMDNPPRDGFSIDHADDYYDYMDVHFSSGVFNKAFYLLATSENWDTKRAFDIMVYANMDYWTPDETFESAACGVFSAASDLRYPAKDVVTAFAEVGVVCDGYRNQPAPVISSIERKGRNRIEVEGDNFCHFQCGNIKHNTETQVVFNGKVMRIRELETEVDEDELTFIIPKGVRTGTVSITTPSGTATINL